MTYYTATSLDGFIADEQHSLEWLFRQDQDGSGPLNQTIVYIAPVTLGGGAPPLPRRLDLELQETARSRAFISARYTVAKADPVDPWAPR